LPSAEEQGDSKSGYNEDICVFCHVKQCKAHPRVFCMKTGYKLLLCFNQIKGSLVQFSQRCYQKNDESNRLKEDVPYPRL
jgi:hypothetical protein